MREFVTFDWNEIVIFGLCTQYIVIIEFFHYYNSQETSTIWDSQAQFL